MPPTSSPSAAPDLLAQACPVCLYAGSIVVRQALLDHCPPDARLVDTAPLDLDQIHRGRIRSRPRRPGKDVARLHSGDLSLYSAVAEQVRRLRALAIPYTLTPGVPAFAAAAALLGVRTHPPRPSPRPSSSPASRAAPPPCPSTEQLETYAATGATLAIHLAITQLPQIITRA